MILLCCSPAASQLIVENSEMTARISLNVLAVAKMLDDAFPDTQAEKLQIISAVGTITINAVGEIYYETSTMVRPVSQGCIWWGCVDVHGWV